MKIVEQTHGPDSPELLSVLTNLGNLDVEQGDLEGALLHRSRAHEIALSKLGPAHPSVGIGAHNIGDLWVQRERCAEATPDFERALAIFEASQGPSARSRARTGSRGPNMDRGQARAAAASRRQGPNSRRPRLSAREEADGRSV